jgi:hypothetical protein
MASYSVTCAISAPRCIAPVLNALLRGGTFARASRK